MKTHILLSLKAIVLFSVLNVYSYKDVTFDNFLQTEANFENNGNNLEYFNEGELDRGYGNDESYDSFELMEDASNEEPEFLEYDEEDPFAMDNDLEAHISAMYDEEASFLEAEGDMDDDEEASFLEAEGDMDDDEEASFLEADVDMDDDEEASFLEYDENELSLLQDEEDKVYFSDPIFLETEEGIDDDEYEDRALLQFSEPSFANQDDEEEEKNRVEEMTNLYKHPNVAEGMEEIISVMDPEDITYQPIRRRLVHSPATAVQQCKQECATNIAEEKEEAEAKETEKEEEDEKEEVEKEKEEGEQEEAEKEKEKEENDFIIPRMGIRRKVIVIGTVIISLILIIFAVVLFTPIIYKKASEGVRYIYNRITGREEELPYTEENQPLVEH